MKVLIAVNSPDWNGDNLVQYLKMKEFDVIEAKSSFILFDMLEKEEFDIAIVSQDLLGLNEKEAYISHIRDLIPIKSNKRLIFHMTYNIEKVRDELINEHFFDFLNGQFKPDELMDLINNPRTFDDVRHFQIRTVRKTIEKSGKEERVVSEEILSTKVLPNKIIGFHGITATTTLWNTAIGLAEDDDLKIIVADFNPNAHLSIQFCYDKYLNIKCMSELIDFLRKDKLNKDTINQFLVQHKKYKNIYLLPGFKNIHDKNFFDFPEAEEGNYLSKILYCLKRNSNIVMVDTPRQFFSGATIDTVKEAETMYFIATPYLPNRIDIKTSTKFFLDKEHNNDFRLIISDVSATEQITSNTIFDELKDIKEYSETGKEICSRNIFKYYLEIYKVSNMNEIIEDRINPYEVKELESYRNSINKIVRDIYYYEGGTYGKESTRNKKIRARGKKLSFPNIFSRYKKN